MKAAIAVVVLGCGLLMSCDRRPPENPLCFARVVELEDSLETYRDSLKELQTAWSFNTLSSMVKMKSHKVGLGDTCMMDVFLAAGNGGRTSFRRKDPVLELTSAGGGAGTPTILKNESIGWKVWFRPTRVGKDSVVGMIRVPHQGAYTDTMDLLFMHRYEVLPE